LAAVGFVAYLAFIFLPGISIGELLHAFDSRPNITERLAIAFGFGIAADTLVMGIRTSGVGPLRGIDIGTIDAVILAGVAILAMSIFLRRKLVFPMRPNQTDVLVFATMVLMVLMLALYFEKYPIFPEYDSYDFFGHVYNTQSIIAGLYTTVPTGILYYGVHYQLAAAYLLTGGDALQRIRTTMAFLVVLSVPVFYLASVKIFSSEKAAIATVLLYATSGAIWYVWVFDSGLFPNFFGVIVSLFAIALFLEFQSGWNWKAWGAFLLTMPAVYLSHYTTLSILPALLVVSVAIGVRKRKQWKNLLVPALVVAIPIVVAAAAYPTLVSTVLSLFTLQGGSVSGSTYLSSALSGIPILSFMAADIYYDLGFVLMWAFVGIYLWKGVATGFSPKLIPLIWMLSLFAISPTSLISWRFAFEAVVPFTLMAAYGISIFTPSLKRGRKNKVRTNSYFKSGLVLGLVIGVTVAGSWGQIMVSDSLTDTSIQATSQGQVYDAINWIQTHTPPNASYLSVSDWRFSQASLLIGRTGLYEFVSTPAEALKLISGTTIGYIIVTNVATVSLSDPSLLPWNNFPSQSNANLTLVYSNPDVKIFQVNK
jgi:hypothetical protein